MEHGLYYEQFELGKRIITPGRTVTEADIVNFAGLSGDFNSIHTDATYSAGSFYEKRVAHGLLVLSIASGLAVRTGMMEGTVMAWREISDWRFSQPVFIGDTVQVELEVSETKPMPRLNAGMVGLEVQVNNQDGKTVMKGRWTLLVLNQP
jgi:acyl dehydratase